MAPHPSPLATQMLVNKSYLKWWEIQLAVHCGEGIVTYVANCKPVALGLQEILYA